MAKHDVATLTGHLVRGLADVTGDKALAALAGDPAKLAEFLPGRHVVDLLEAYPNRLTPPQLTGLLRGLPARLYSVASSQKLVGEEAHLLVSAVRYHTHGRDRGGVASTDIADRRKVGDTLPIYVKPNQHFRLPSDPAVPIIMIGPGTGVAPFRAFMQERDALGVQGRSWLFFGDQRYTHDFLYQLEWQDLLARGLLTRIDVAFSRDQDKKIYVQHRMWEHRKNLYSWMQDGARIYVCGDQSRMAKDVHATLRDVIADGGAINPEAAEAQLSDMKRAGRYLLDVY
jgi:sulfite reductase (NADPH) flavoprotein alpha-component